MRKTTIYVDTSVLGGVRDEEFSAASQALLRYAQEGRYHLLISALTYREISGAPGDVQQVLRELPLDTFTDIPVTEEAQALAAAYVSANVLGPASYDDALHVAVATVAGADMIVSWNFRHLVNVDRIRKFSAVNLMLGYPPMDIRSPKEFGGAD